MNPINTPTVPLDEAVARVTRFRDQLINQVPEASIPRAVLIPIEDLMAIIEKFTFTDDSGRTVSRLEGVRAYFAVKETDTNLDNDITALIVPVDKLGRDVISGAGGYTGEDTNIYDFTKPCPDQCDPESPLYIE